MRRMSEVTVTAVQPVLGLDEGVTVTVERTRRIDAHIASGSLRVVEADEVVEARRPSRRRRKADADETPAEVEAPAEDDADAEPTTEE